MAGRSYASSMLLATETEDEDILSAIWGPVNGVDPSGERLPTSRPHRRPSLKNPYNVRMTADRFAHTLRIGRPTVPHDPTPGAGLGTAAPIDWRGFSSGPTPPSSRTANFRTSPLPLIPANERLP
jgi:hypothetical protein